MKILAADGFKQYTNFDDLAQNWISGRSPAVIHTSATLSEMRGVTGGPDAVMTRPIEEVSRCAISVDIRIPSTVGVAIISVNPDGYGDRNRTTSGDSPRGVYLSISGMVPRLYYEILSGPTGTESNAMMLAEGAPLIAGQTYHVEMIVDHSQAIASCSVYINGAIAIDVFYDRDRIQSGFEALSFGEASLYSTGGSASTIPLFSNFVVYDPQVSDPLPLGPLDVAYLVTPTTALKVGPAVDTTGVSVLDSEWADFAISDVDPAAEIIGAELVYRLAAISGQDAAVAEIALESLGVQVGVTAQHSITPGYGPVLHSLSLPPSSLTPATLNGMTLKVRSASGGA